MLRFLLLPSLLLAALLLGTAPARAEEVWPSRPIRLLVGFPPGGIADLLGRLSAQALGERLGVAVVVENRAGAGGLLAAEACARAAPDGHTFCILAAPVGSVAPLLRGTRPGFDAATAFAPVLLLGTEPLVLLADPALPLRDAAGLAAWVVARGHAPLGSTGAGTTSHMTVEWLRRGLGLPIEHVPFRGSGQAINAVLGGQIPAAVMVAGGVMTLLREGRLRPLAVTGATRSPLLPEVPTLRETLLPDLAFENYQGLFAPAGTPGPVVARVAALLAEALGRPPQASRLRDQGFEPLPLPTDAFAAWLAAGGPGWRALVDGSGVTGLE